MNVDGLHIPILIIADKMCFDCIDRWKVNEMRESCVNNCGIFFFNNNNDFCYWLLEQKNNTGFAYNLKAYDGIFHSKQNGIFNFNEELYKYCLRDVTDVYHIAKYF